MTSDTMTPVSYRTNELAIPERLRPFAEPALIAGESREDYELLRQLLIEDIQPRSNLEWLWLFDLAELSWEILRYRKLKVRAIEMHRVKAIEALLLQIDGAGMPESNLTLQWRSKVNALDWQTIPLARSEIEARLRRHDFDLCAVNAVVYIQAQASVQLFEELARNAQSKRIVLANKLSSVKNTLGERENLLP